MKFLALLILVTFQIHALQGPRYLSTRALGMGNAFVALSDDYNGLFYNPAGLSYMNSTLDAGAAFKLDMGDFFGLAGDAINIAGQHANSLGNMDSMANDDAIVDDLMLFDRRPVYFGSMPEMHFAAHSQDPSLPLTIGAAWFLSSQADFLLDKGIYLPGAVGGIRTDLAFLAAGAMEIMPRWSIGIAPEVATFARIEQAINLEAYQSAADTLTAQLNRQRSRIYHPGFGLGLNVGTIYELIPTELRVGFVANHLFLSMDDQAVHPKFSVGLAYLPGIFKNQGLLRYLNLALDYEDITSSRPALSRLNVGTEMNMNLAQIRTGLKGGYPCFGLALNLAILQMEFVSWADELGLYTGQWEQRHYLINFRIGI